VKRLLAMRAGPAEHPTAVAGCICGACVCLALSVLLLVGLYALQPLPAHDELAPLFEIATGYAWAENMACVHRSASLDPARSASLFVTDNKRGELSRIDWLIHNHKGHYAPPVVHPASAAFELMAGIAVDRRAERVYLLGNRLALPFGDGRCVVAEILDPFAHEDEEPEATYRVVAHLDRHCLGDGLAVHERTGLLYWANQGKFVPNHGAVSEVDPHTGSVTQIIHGSFTDGAAIDQERGLLYVSETLSPSHSVLVYDLVDRAVVGRIHPRGVTALDDFVLTHSGSVIVAADFLGNSGVRFKTGFETGKPRWKKTHTEMVRALVSGVTEPTSIRRGCSNNLTSGFNKELFFVTEGGGLSALSRDRRVLAFALPETPPATSASETQASHARRRRSR